MNFLLLFGRKLVEPPHGHPAADRQDRGMALLAAQAPQPLALPLVWQTIDANAINLDFGEWSSRKHAAPRCERGGYCISRDL